ncbi:D-alanyl-D-alanine carboxypeptidase/D-alanyl-D-alanine-endopeptidase [Actinopolymorpha alba]|uniref:D-alanyl-D-alanine carboxypeptidase/D-alanyl-D-alanine endopeptidase n=1 Tax=Actinopolymorpha alba TaxID=533267 RepID=UPI000372E175|nr:D-alanyl-D-alanine carboxypeptidase/D-alanyl-D-alanine-endopeptidase [Actinopolymorpha alba]
MRLSTRHLVVAGVSTLSLLGVSVAPSVVPSVLRAEPTKRDLAAAPASATAADPIDGLRRDLDAILNQPGVPEGHASVQVRTASGEVLYEREASERLLPASNAKLFSSAAALEVLGPDHRLTTSVLTAAAQTGSSLRGDLYLRGQGDPTMLAKDYDDLAAKVAASGIQTVTGKLVADDTWYDATRLGNSWGWDDEPYYYSGQISALTVSPDQDYDAGTVIVETRPGAKAGDPARTTVVPDTGYVRIVNQATTAASGSTDISVEREHGTNTIVVSGTIPVTASAKRTWATVSEPTGYAADVFRRALKKHGVRVLGGTSYAATPAGARSLATHESMTLAQLLVPFLKLSNNGHAEVLVKEMGRKASGKGTWSAGLTAMSSALAGLGVNTNSLRLVDGSGLSRQDFVAPQQITNLLIGARGKAWFPTWYAALPIAGESDRFVGGTLRSRMPDTAAAGNVHAKTGSLTAVSGLSGYVTSADGEPLVFSVLQNYYLNVNAKQVEDQIAIRLAEFSRKATKTVRGIPAVPRTAYGPSDVECAWVKAC